MLHVVLAGGGTAGHTSPLIATAQALGRLEPGVKITCIGTERGLETRLIPETGLRLELIPAVPLPRKLTLDLLKVPFRLIGAVKRARRIIRGADTVVGFGGYVSMPVYLAARISGIPVVIQEQNALPGLANKVASRFSAVTLTSFPGTPLPGARFEGMPLREQITELATHGRTARQGEQRERFGLHPDLPVLLVSGGSQGARSLNDATVQATNRLLEAGVQILHVWGARNFHDRIAGSVASNGARYVPLAYVDNMADAYAAADVMLARSGAGTVVETAVVGLPTIFVPLPIGNGEQARNAAPLVAADAAIVIDDDDLDADLLTTTVNTLVKDPGRLSTMSRAASELMLPGAAERVGRIVLDIARGRR
ncbi:undecaprenyldiphospho-muramoylpentapeptide beta-N-acetylglucosaminyltransferase [Propionibacterium sp. oral taxon 192 str. F0372]|uniref:undecaprenyldiphospho-muramoylpentapeptide beta-N-acetylglucosaminyltransferase n=1 Tax=Propionibacterium sp. oral taxon 192 TaxID=671222 RepID=UPI000352D9BF|nr:undecaprenyldiphospho-muramoylpentapeptide beta-N-acetylglucosaminyltransferase [Propionibacterium sp. oral taxon 192]EPH02617.1 undecaprenyldiphospho-muramoylpentapeptide beta-N-acetylglucosaminyltransferase [Propionibacterium sp. oral taxon 192 str. F0372]